MADRFVVVRGWGCYHPGTLRVSHTDIHKGDFENLYLINSWEQHTRLWGWSGCTVIYIYIYIFTVILYISAFICTHTVVTSKHFKCVSHQNRITWPFITRFQQILNMSISMWTPGQSMHVDIQAFQPYVWADHMIPPALVIHVLL